jgi:CDGSH-type Zn-finger protein
MPRKDPMKRAEYLKEYKKSEKYKAWLKEVIVCECGVSVNKKHKYEHIKTKNHIKTIALMLD